MFQKVKTQPSKNQSLKRLILSAIKILAREPYLKETYIQKISFTINLRTIGLYKVDFSVSFLNMSVKGFSNKEVKVIVEKLWRKAKRHINAKFRELQRKEARKKSLEEANKMSFF